MRWIGRLGRAVAGVSLLVPLALLLALSGARAFGYGTQVIVSGSMAPAAPVGSVVVTRPLAADDVRAGDVVLIRRSRPGQPLAPVMHRVVSVRDAGDGVALATKGDANATTDPEPYVVRDSTMTPVAVVPYLGFVLATS